MGWEIDDQDSVPEIVQHAHGLKEVLTIGVETVAHEDSTLGAWVRTLPSFQLPASRRDDDFFVRQIPLRRGLFRGDSLRVNLKGGQQKWKESADENDQPNGECHAASGRGVREDCLQESFDTSIEQLDGKNQKSEC